MKAAPLPRLAPDVDVAAETFTSKVERFKLQLRTNRDATTLAQSISEDVALLPDFVWQNRQLDPPPSAAPPTSCSLPPRRS